MTDAPAPPVAFSNVPEDDEAEAQAVTAINMALSAALIEARQASGFDGATADRLTAIALATLVMRQRRINPAIPVATTRMLVGMLTKLGYGERLGVADPYEAPF